MATAFIISSNRTALDAYAADYLAPCPECHKPFTGFDLASMGVTADEVAEWRTRPAVHDMSKLAYHCHACIVNIEHQNAREKAESRQRKLAYNTYRFGLMPKDAKDETIENSSDSVMGRNPEAWLLAGRGCPTSNLWVKGEPGTGKTFYAHCIANLALASGTSVASVKGERINAIGDLFDEKRQTALKDLREVRLLIIDDIDKPTYSPRGLDVMLSLMDARMRGKLRTIFTANASGSWLAGVWKNVRPDNPSIAKSIMERMLPVQTIEITGESLRG